MLIQDEIFRGVIKTIDARVAQESRNVLVRGQLDNTKKQLRPGMFANVNVLAGEPHKVMTLPRTAITYSLYGDSVFVVKPLRSGVWRSAGGAGKGGGGHDH